MKARPGTPNADRCAGSLTLQLAPALSEYLRREAASQEVDPAELASRLLMRGLRAERLDEFASDMACSEGACGASEESGLAARVEAAALLAVLSAWRDSQAECASPQARRSAENTSLDASPSPGASPSPDASPSPGAMRELLERVGARRGSR